MESAGAAAAQPAHQRGARAPRAPRPISAALQMVAMPVLRCDHAQCCRARHPRLQDARAQEREAPRRAGH
eukprot:7997118-Lingulodinium_polyedra.AAC.1